MAKLFRVKATLKGMVIWHFTAITAKDKDEAITTCKHTMKHVMGTIPRFKWIAESEWEDNLSVN